MSELVWQTAALWTRRRMTIFFGLNFSWTSATNGICRLGLRTLRRRSKRILLHARAYAGLAWALVNLANPGGGGHSTKGVLLKARAAAARALELDPLLADAHVSLALVLEADWNWSEEENEHRLALKLGPNSWGAHSSYGRESTVSNSTSAFPARAVHGMSGGWLKCL
jgi:hypothetical protein